MSDMQEVVKGYKAFGRGMVCRGKQYAENTEFEEEGGNICEPGMMHFCENPFDVLDYYPLVDDKGNVIEVAEVEPLDEVVNEGNKSASRKLRIGAKLNFGDFIRAGIKALIKKTNTEEQAGNYIKISSSGDSAQIGSSGYLTQICSSGNGAQIGSSGGYAQICSSGNGAQIGSSGGYAQICSSGNGAQIGSSGDCAKIGSSGYHTRICSSGNCAKIGSSGDSARIVMHGGRSVAASTGSGCTIAGKKGDWIVLAEWGFVNGVIAPECVKAAQIDGEVLKEDTAYMLKNGEFVEA